MKIDDRTSWLPVDCFDHRFISDSILFGMLYKSINLYFSTPFCRSIVENLEILFGAAENSNTRWKLMFFPLSDIENGSLVVLAESFSDISAVHVRMMTGFDEYFYTSGIYRPTMRMRGHPIPVRISAAIEKMRVD